MATLLKGQPVAESLRRQIAADILSFQSHGVSPKVVTLLVEGDPASLYYARAKKRLAAKLGIHFELVTFQPEVQETELLNAIQRLNRDKSVHGIMLELPLPSHVSTDVVIETINPLKDVDGLTQWNRHANMMGTEGIYPATPMACVRLIKHYGYPLSGQHVVLVGCGKTVGMPLFHLLLRENATVTACHVGTPDISVHLRHANVAFVAVGRAELITPSMVHSQLVIVDAGINETSDQKIVGDVAAEVSNHVEAMSPTPGGVGTVTTMQLFANLMHALRLQQKHWANWLSPTPR